MKVFLKLLTFVATAFFVIATIIKFTQNVSYKEAVGIMEEFCKEMKAKCPCCKPEQEAAGEEAKDEG
jgi:hypothetical protein